jgi:hypothetical protein
MEKPNENEINYNELIETCRAQSNKDINESEYNINLALLSSNMDYQSKIQCWALKTFLHYKLKNQNELLTYYKKVLKFINEKTLTKVDQNLAFCIIRIMYRCGCILQENKSLFLAAQCMFEAKNIFEEKQIRTERDSLETLENSFSTVLKEISSEVIFE